MPTHTRHHLIPSRETLHGRFSPDLPPALVVDSGDVVRVRTLDVGWGLAPPTDETSPREKWGPREPGRDDGPAMVGPIAIRGALPGMTLAVRIREIVPAPWGWTWAGGGGFKDPRLDRAVGVADQPARLMRWALDATAATATNQHGHVVRVRPFPGVIGLSPGAAGWHEGWYPGATGGNMDCKELYAGSTLYLPVAAPGGLLSVGDGHAAQGDGEVAGMAIETMFEAIELGFELVDDWRIGTPHVENAAGWSTLGFGEDLDGAIATALAAMVDLIQRLHGIADRRDALALASVAADLRLTQLVNGVRGAHAFLPHGAIS